MGTLTLGLGLDPLQKRSALAAPLPGEDALQQLMEGNQRFVTGASINPDHGLARIKSLAQSQAPAAVILGCADSRVPPELVFDQGLGRLFTIRVAGNIADDANLGSIEYAVESLGVQLVMVLGHERCGAVTAALGALKNGVHLPGHLEALTNAVTPAIANAIPNSNEKPSDRLDQAVRANIRFVVQKLSSSPPILGQRVASKKLKIVGGYYDLDSGAVEIII
jgi:carbonic anhydrase